MKTIIIMIMLMLMSATIQADSLWIQGQDADSIFDAKMYESASYDDRNFGGSYTITVLGSSGGDRVGLFRFTNMAAIGSDKIIDSMCIDLYCETGNSGLVNMFRMLKPWYEGSSDNANEAGAVDDNHWYCSDSAWSTNCADSCDDAGAPNRTNGEYADRRCTALDTVRCSNNNVRYRFWVPASLAQGWYNGDSANYGVTFREIPEDGLITSFSSSEKSPQTDRRPIVVVYYHAAGGEEEIRRRRRRTAEWSMTEPVLDWLGPEKDRHQVDDMMTWFITMCDYEGYPEPVAVDWDGLRYDHLHAAWDETR